MDKYKFGEFIYQKRKKIGLTQEELGRKLGVTNKAVSKWEVGETLPDLTMLKPLADLLQVTVDELLSQKEVKVEEKKVIKKNNLLLILVIVLATLEILTVTSFLINNNYQKRLDSIVYVDESNYQEVVNIIPMYDFVLDNQTITINSLYGINDAYYLDEDELNIKIVYQIDYYYYCNDGTLGIITYYNRIVDVVFDAEKSDIEYSIVLEPKTEIMDYKSLKNVEITYEVTDCSGVVYKK